ncbi:MAG TPA: hypothetical protein VHI51_11160 [Ktedonobacterales bacterium]|nr:hypothetical protein [Ktedonobacterales bacterium]
MRGIGRWNPPRRRWLALIVAALLLFVAFEVSIRLITPDAMEFTLTFTPCKPYNTFCTTPPKRSFVTTDPSQIAMYQALLEPPNEGKLLVDAYLEAWTGVGCPSAPTTNQTTLRFTWHGIPVEATSSGPGCDNGWTQVSSGGLPDLNMYVLDFFGR